jgi:hypothetical protein
MNKTALTCFRRTETQAGGTLDDESKNSEKPLEAVGSELRALQLWQSLSDTP